MATTFPRAATDRALRRPRVDVQTSRDPSHAPGRGLVPIGYAVATLLARAECDAAIVAEVLRASARHEARP